MPSPPRRAPRTLLDLQRDAGNRAVCQLLAVQRYGMDGDHQIGSAPSKPGDRGRIHLDGLGDFPFTSDVTWTLTNAVRRVTDKHGPVRIEAGRLGIETFSFTTPMSRAAPLLQHYQDTIMKGRLDHRNLLSGWLGIPGWHLLLHDTSLTAVRTGGGDTKVDLQISAVEVEAAGPARTPKDRKDFTGWLRFDGAASPTPVLAWQELETPAGGNREFRAKVLPSRGIGQFVQATAGKRYARRNLQYVPKSGAPVELAGVLMKKVQSTTSGGRTVLDVGLVAEHAQVAKKR